MPSSEANPADRVVSVRAIMSARAAVASVTTACTRLISEACVSPSATPCDNVERRFFSVVPLIRLDRSAAVESMNSTARGLSRSKSMATPASDTASAPNSATAALVLDLTTVAIRSFSMAAIISSISAGPTCLVTRPLRDREPPARAGSTTCGISGRVGRLSPSPSGNGSSPASTRTCVMLLPFSEAGLKLAAGPMMLRAVSSSIVGNATRIICMAVSGGISLVDTCVTIACNAAIWAPLSAAACTSVGVAPTSSSSCGRGCSSASSLTSSSVNAAGRAFATSSLNSRFSSTGST